MEAFQSSSKMAGPSCSERVLGCAGFRVVPGRGSLYSDIGAAGRIAIAVSASESFQHIGNKMVKRVV